MRCSATTFVLTLCTLVSSILSVLTSYMAINETIELLRKYGPEKGEGNPILDYEDEEDFFVAKDKIERIEIATTFSIVQHVSIFVAVLMVFNSLLFMWDSVRSKKLFLTDPTLTNKDFVMNKITCSGWLTGYSIFLAVAWMIAVIFCVIPVHNYKLVEQDCKDLSLQHSAHVYKEICVNLVEMGMISFEDKGRSYGKICGFPSGDTSAKATKATANLNMLCDKYQPASSLFLTALVSAAFTVLSLILFAVLHAANFTHVKERRMHFVVVNGVASGAFNNSSNLHSHIPPQHQAMLQDQLMSIHNSSNPHMHYNHHHHNLYNNSIMDTVEEESAIVENDALELRNMTMRSHHRPTSRASTVMRYKSASRAPSMSTLVNGGSHLPPPLGANMRQPQPDDLASVRSHALSHVPSRIGAPHHMSDIEDDDDEEMAMKRVGDGSSGGELNTTTNHHHQQQRRQRRHSSDDDVTKLRGDEPESDEMEDDDDYGAARSVRSYRHHNASRHQQRQRSLYRKRKRGAQSDTDISRHVMPAREPNRSSTMKRQHQQPRPSAQDEYDSPPSDYYQREDLIRSNVVGGASGSSGRGSKQQNGGAYV